MTVSVEGHTSRWATTVVTAVGGIWKDAPWAIAVSTCRNFTNPSPPRIAAITTSVRISRFTICSPRFVDEGLQTKLSKQNNCQVFATPAKGDPSIAVPNRFRETEKDSYTVLSVTLPSESALWVL